MNTLADMISAIASRRAQGASGTCCELKLVVSVMVVVPGKSSKGSSNIISSSPKHLVLFLLFNGALKMH